MKRRNKPWLIVHVFIPSLILQIIPAATFGRTEFWGPFPSWRNIKSDYGAKGDGITDDTAAIQAALNTLIKHRNSCVLYFPAGTYRITSTIQTVRKAHTDCQGVAIVGEHPQTTLLKWDGPVDGTLFRWDAWYSKISRLTLDGSGRTEVALYYGPSFSTYNETSDMVFTDTKTGIRFGDAKSAGQAENAVLRCRFLRCTEAGLQTVNFNSMDIWVWHCRFDDCGYSLYNVMGNFHAWYNQFTRSTRADIGTQNLMVFSFVGNVSLESRRFMDFDSGHTWGSPTTIDDNRIIDATDDLPLKLGNAGPYLVMDNAFRLRDDNAQRACQMTWGDQTFVGNTYTRSNAVVERGRFRRVMEQEVSPDRIDASRPSLPDTPVDRKRKVFEVESGSDADTIQEAIDSAAGLAGQRPVVHLPMGVYSIKKTLVIPAGADIQLVGDSAGETGTRLNWIGPPDGVSLHLKGPTKACLADFYLNTPNGRGILVDNADQSGGCIFAEQLNASGPQNTTSPSTSAVLVNGLENTKVQFRCLQGSGNSGTWVTVLGGAYNGNSGLVSIFTGATGSALRQYHVSSGGNLTVRGVYHEKSSDSLQGICLDDKGTLAIDATRFSYKTSPTAPLVSVHNFDGLLTIATSLLLPVDSTHTCRISISGDGSSARVLALNNQFWLNELGVTANTVWQNRATPPAEGGLLGCNVNSNLKGATPKGFAFLKDIGNDPDMAKSPDGSGPLNNRGILDDESLLLHLAPLRNAQVWEPSPSLDASTNLSIYRVMVSAQARTAVELHAGNSMLKEQ